MMPNEESSKGRVYSISCRRQPAGRFDREGRDHGSDEPSANSLGADATGHDFPGPCPVFAMLAAAFREVVMEFEIETAPRSVLDWTFCNLMLEFLDEVSTLSMSNEEMGRAFREWLQRRELKEPKRKWIRRHRNA